MSVLEASCNLQRRVSGSRSICHDDQMTSFKVPAHQRMVFTFQKVLKLSFTHFPTRARIFLLPITSMKSSRKNKKGVEYFFIHINLLDLESSDVIFCSFAFAILILLVGDASFFIFFLRNFFLCSSQVNSFLFLMGL